MGFATISVALGDVLNNVLGQRQQTQFGHDLYVATREKTLEIAVVFQLPKAPFGLDGTVHPQQLSLVGCDSLKGLLAKPCHFPTDLQFLGRIGILGPAAGRAMRTLTAIPAAVVRHLALGTVLGSFLCGTHS